MNEKYERLTVTASDGSVGIRRGYSKDDLIARLVELEDGIEHNRIAILPYNEGSFVNYGDEKALIRGYVIQNNQLYIQLDAYERPNEKYRCFWIEPDDEKLVVPKSEPRPLPDGMSRVKIEFKDEKERFYPEFDFDNNIKPVKEQTTKTGVFYNGEKIWNSRKTI